MSGDLLALEAVGKERIGGEHVFQLGLQPVQQLFGLVLVLDLQSDDQLGNLEGVGLARQGLHEGEALDLFHLGIVGRHAAAGSLYHGANGRELRGPLRIW